MEQTITFKLEDFEGPLDLLLYLVSKNKMNIYNIEIVALIDQYVSMVNGLPVYQMESASEFIEMAARLVQMKSYFLLPKSEEAERMKEELTGMLVEYSACKEVAYIPWCVNRPRSSWIPSTACVTMYICWRKRTTPCRDAAVRSSRPVRSSSNRLPPRLSFPSPHVSYMCCAA